MATMYRVVGTLPLFPDLNLGQTSGDINIKGEVHGRIQGGYMERYMETNSFLLHLVRQLLVRIGVKIEGLSDLFIVNQYRGTQ